MSAFADVRDNVDGSSHNVQRQRPEEDRRGRRNRERDVIKAERVSLIYLNLRRISLNVKWMQEAKK